MLLVGVSLHGSTPAGQLGLLSWVLIPSSAGCWKCAQQTRNRYWRSWGHKFTLERMNCARPQTSLTISMTIDLVYDAVVMQQIHPCTPSFKILLFAKVAVFPVNVCTEWNIYMKYLTRRYSRSIQSAKIPPQLDKLKVKDKTLQHNRWRDKPSFTKDFDVSRLKMTRHSFTCLPRHGCFDLPFRSYGCKHDLHVVKAFQQYCHSSYVKKHLQVSELVQQWRYRLPRWACSRLVQRTRTVSIEITGISDGFNFDPLGHLFRRVAWKIRQRDLQRSLRQYCWS